MSLRFKLPKSQWTTASLAVGVIVIAAIGSTTEHSYGASAGTPADDALNRAFGLQRSVQATLHLSTNGSTLTTRVPLGAGWFSVDLEPSSPRAAGYQVLVQQADGSYEESAPREVRTYRGTVRGLAGARVAASVDDLGLWARVIMANESDYWIEPVAARVPGAARSAHVIYTSADIVPVGATCAAKRDANFAREADLLAASATGACGASLCAAKLACDADVEFFQRWGSVGAVEDRINALINAVNIQFERDVAIRHVITTIIVRTGEPDPYTSTSASTLLGQFRSQWENNHTAIDRDLAQLFTGKDLDGTTIGVAWIGGVCGSVGYSVVQADFTSNFGAITDLCAHEFGHNWSADHCACSGSPSYTMNSFVTAANQFHPTLTVPEVVAYRDSRICLAPVDACSTDSDCGDGLFCNGNELCNAGACESGPAPCPDQDCDEGGRVCVDGCPSDPNKFDPGECGCGVPDVDSDSDGTADCNDACPGDPNKLGPGECGCGVSDVDSNGNGIPDCFPQACNGDGACDPGETCDNCPSDCFSGGVCGNGICEAGNSENHSVCPSDCNGKLDGKKRDRFSCGVGGQYAVGCGDPRCSQGGYACTDGGETACCGDGSCDGAENACLCPLDCGSSAVTEASCTDGLDDNCDGLTDCNDASCASDPACSTVCGNGTCEPGEDCHNCSNDCAGKQNGQPSRRYCCGNGVPEGPETTSLCDGNY